MSVNFIDTTEQERLFGIISDRFDAIKAFFIANSLDEAQLSVLNDQVYSYFGLLAQAMNGFQNDQQNNIISAEINDH